MPAGGFIEFKTKDFSQKINEKKLLRKRARNNFKK